MKQKQMHVAMLRKRPKHLKMTSRQPRQTEQRDALRQINKPRLLLETRARAREPFSRIRSADLSAKLPPQLSLPSRVRRNPILPGRPSMNQLRPMKRVPVIEVSEMPNRPKPPGTASLIVIRVELPEMSSKSREPRLTQAPINNLKKRPNSPLRKPRIPIRLDPRSSSNSIPNKPTRRRKLNVGANTIGPLIASTKSRRHPLSKPPLHPPSRNSNNLPSKRIRKQISEKRPKRLDQALGPFCSMHVKHMSCEVSATDRPAHALTERHSARAGRTKSSLRWRKYVPSGDG